MKIDSGIRFKRNGFEESFRVGEYYNKQTRDDTHLELILRCIQVEPGMKILDLGTGSGYLAFPFAEKYKQVEVVGLDIVEKTLEENQRKAELEGINNLRFVSYDGMDFPFDPILESCEISVQYCTCGCLHVIYSMAAPTGK